MPSESESAHSSASFGNASIESSTSSPSLVRWLPDQGVPVIRVQDSVVVVIVVRIIADAVAVAIKRFGRVPGKGIGIVTDTVVIGIHVFARIKREHVIDIRNAISVVVGIGIVADAVAIGIADSEKSSGNASKTSETPSLSSSSSSRFSVPSLSVSSG